MKFRRHSVRLLAGYEDEARTGLARMPRWVRDSAALEPVTDWRSRGARWKRRDERPGGPLAKRGAMAPNDGSAALQRAQCPLDV